MMDREVVIKLAIDADLPDIIQLDADDSNGIVGLIRALIRGCERLHPPTWKDFDVDGYHFSIKVDGQGGLLIGRESL